MGMQSFEFDSHFCTNTYCFDISAVREVYLLVLKFYCEAKLSTLFWESCIQYSIAHNTWFINNIDLSIFHIS